MEETKTYTFKNICSKIGSGATPTGGKNAYKGGSAPVLYQYLLLPEVEEHFVLKTESRSGTFPQGSYTDLATIRVPFAREQNNITNSLDKIRQKIYSSQQENH